jgi:hypothetical protein
VNVHEIGIKPISVDERLIKIFACTENRHVVTLQVLLPRPTQTKIQHANFVAGVPIPQRKRFGRTFGAAQSKASAYRENPHKLVFRRLANTLTPWCAKALAK